MGWDGMAMGWDGMVVMAMVDMLRVGWEIGGWEIGGQGFIALLDAVVVGM